MNKEDILQLYLNYLKSLEIRKEHGDKYGDTDELIEMYEEKLDIKRRIIMNKDIKLLKEQLENLKEIERQHQKLNGELREEIKKLELKLEGKKYE